MENKKNSYMGDVGNTIAAGSRYTVGIKSDGTVTAVGDNKYGQCDINDWCSIDRKK